MAEIIGGKYIVCPNCEKSIYINDSVQSKTNQRICDSCNLPILSSDTVFMSFKNNKQITIHYYCYKPKSHFYTGSEHQKTE